MNARNRLQRAKKGIKNMITEGIIIAIITGGLAVVSNVVVVLVNNSKTLLRIDLLERKVEKHNNYMERLIMAEMAIKNIAEELEELKSKV